MAPTTKDSKRNKSKKESPPQKNTKSGEKKRRKKINNVNFKIYIYKVLKQVHPEFGISSKGMDIMDSFIKDMFERIALEASQLVKLSKHRTLLANDIQTAVKLVIPGELAKHAVSEGVRALSNYDSSKK